jgi:hypothetical protein
MSAYLYNERAQCCLPPPPAGRKYATGGSGLSAAQIALTSRAAIVTTTNCMADPLRNALALPFLVSLSKEKKKI